MGAMNDVLAAGTVLHSNFHEYRIIKVLGRGGFGITYLAMGRQPGMPEFQCAIKEHFYRDGSYRDEATGAVKCGAVQRERVEASRKDFLVEAKRLNKICAGHDNIVNVGDVFTANNTAYYMMEFIDGLSLRDYVLKQVKRPLTAEEALNVLYPVVDAIKYLHANRLTHLDIKPDNIMIDRRGEIKIIDFGLSKQYNDDGEPVSQINMQGCSDGYSPLEQYSGITSFTPQADVYALGATLLFCLTAKDPPRSLEINAARISKLLPQGTPDAITRIVQASMRINKYERVPSAAYFWAAPSASEVEKITGHSFATSQSVTPPAEKPEPEKGQKKPVRKPRRKGMSPWAVSLLAVFMVLLAGAGTFFLIRGAQRAHTSHEQQTAPPDTTEVVVEEAVAQ